MSTNKHNPTQSTKSQESLHTKTHGLSAQLGNNQPLPAGTPVLFKDGNRGELANKWDGRKALVEVFWAGRDGKLLKFSQPTLIENVTLDLGTPAVEQKLNNLRFEAVKVLLLNVWYAKDAIDTKTQTIDWEAIDVMANRINPSTSEILFVDAAEQLWDGRGTLVELLTKLDGYHAQLFLNALKIYTK